jgi:N-carbamoylputrescine amidase
LLALVKELSFFLYVSALKFPVLACYDISMPEKFTIGLIQMRCSKDAEENRARAVEKIREASKRGAQIICMHELFLGEYFCRTEDPALFDLAEAVPGPATEALSTIAKESKVSLVVSLFERRAAGIYHNTCAVIDGDGSYLGKYRKMHIPDDPLYYEKFYFTPGDLGFPNFDTRYGRLGVQICWDQWYPEGSRLTALKGAQVIFYPTSIGWHPKEKAEFGAAQLDAWKTIQRAHAIANGIFVAVVNRVGYEGNSASGDPGIEFWGNSFVADPFGQILAQAGSEKEEILVVECDPTKSEETRRNWPFLRDRRIDAYQPILNRWLGE